MPQRTLTFLTPDLLIFLVNRGLNILFSGYVYILRKDLTIYSVYTSSNFQASACLQKWYLKMEMDSLSDAEGPRVPEVRGCVA